MDDDESFLTDTYVSQCIVRS